MDRPDPASAVVVRVPLPPALARIRERWDLASAMGVPAHVTVLFPFLPGRELDPTVRGDLAAIAAACEPFDVRYERVDRFPGVIYLAPEPSAPFAELTAAVVAQFPGYLPYGGAHDEVIPHLTITENDRAPLDEIADRAAAALPFTRRVHALELLVERPDGRWGPRWRLRLGVRR